MSDQKRPIREPGPMSVELRRWSSRPRTHASRWADWAASIGGRHSRMALRQEALSFTLARSLSMIHLLRERLLVSSERFYPQVNLSIHATLRNTMAVGAPQLIGSSRAALESKPEEHARAYSSHTAVERTFVERSAVGSGDIKVDLAHGLKDVLISEKPLQLVFQRLLKIGEGRESLTLRRAIEQVEETILRRVVDQSRRIEAAPALASALITKQSVKAPSKEAAASMDRQSVTDSTIEQVVSRKLSEQIAAGSSNAVTTRTASWAPAAAQLNIDLIADQVMRKLDRRVEAWRERTGRV